MSFRKMVPFLLLNALVSATVVLAILFWWSSRNPQVAVVPESSAVVAAVASGEPIPTSDQIPTLAPTIPPTLTPTPEPTTYTVQAGDTLGTISDRFGVPIDDILTVNGITNPNFLQVGQELIIPIEGLNAAEPEPEPTATIDLQTDPPTPIPTVPLGSGEVELQIFEVTGVGELGTEKVRIVNTGERPVELENWQIVDESGAAFNFGRVTLYGFGAGVDIHTEAEPPDAAQQDLLLAFYWGQESAVWEPGETVRLIDSEGTEQATYLIPSE